MDGFERLQQRELQPAQRHFHLTVVRGDLFGPGASAHPAVGREILLLGS